MHQLALISDAASTQKGNDTRRGDVLLARYANPTLIRACTRETLAQLVYHVHVQVHF